MKKFMQAAFAAATLSVAAFTLAPAADASRSNCGGARSTMTPGQKARCGVGITVTTHNHMKHHHWYRWHRHHHRTPY